MSKIYNLEFCEHANECKDISQKKEVIYNIIGTTSLWDMEGQIESFVELLNKR